ncbi:hypothetical protein AB0L30_16640 [Microbispora rosea]|uniref:hypothetical protein n=2 Tax=Microbispora rosea TaxID=58117 RepID=UPI00341EC224
MLVNELSPAVQEDAQAGHLQSRKRPRTPGTPTTRTPDGPEVHGVGCKRFVEQHILDEMKPASGASRRHLPTSPFKPPPPAPPVEQFSVNDQVTHDRYGLGVVVEVEEGVAVIVDFRSQQERILTPYKKLHKL